MTSFTIGDTDFLLDGAPHRVLAGAVHYFRVHPDQWSDRIHKARLLGLNTIETYVAWNAHEPTKGDWSSEGWNDLARFLDLIAAEGMHAIVRPGPYICAEWHNGGLPVWLTSDPTLRLRSSDAAYLAEVARYLRNVYEIVVPRQIDRGGNVILVQIENEYGAYGSDKDYLAELVRVTREAGITVPLTTVDQPQPQMLRDGSLPELHKTGSFGSRAADRLATLREHQPTGPLMCSEFWNGWFDWWGGHHHTTTPESSADELDSLLAAGASVNLYMFHGGTNFGLTNGANDKGRYLPLATSYDYDAPLDEAGHPTAKFHAFREVIARYAPVPDEVPPAAPAAPAFDITLESTGVWLTAAAPDAELHPTPPTFEQLGTLGALVLYETDIPFGLFRDGRPAALEFDEVRDMAWVRADGRAVGTLSRTRRERAMTIPAATKLSILVEEQGRVNYDERLGEPKGLIGTPRLNGSPLTGWTATPIDVSALAQSAASARIAPRMVNLSAEGHAGPVALRGTFDLTTPADLFLGTESWGKGFAFVNGFLLGRYWRTGPQQTLYVPAPVTRTGRNDLVVIELEQVTAGVASFLEHPVLGPLSE